MASVLEKTNNIASDSHDIKRKFAKATNEAKMNKSLSKSLSRIHPVNDLDP